jgi:hypothetical protein
MTTLLLPRLGAQLLMQSAREAEVTAFPTSTAV